ncbi:MAG: IreB family regulatory phosphoprotein, partial [Oscillospiraceae bacterium]|nr:IreB family regulatory phosphoprotein [Oscillospiraceae bacterium]
MQEKGNGKKSGGDRLMDSTIKFRPVQEHRRAMQEALREVYNALVEKGYNPI